MTSTNDSITSDQVAALYDATVVSAGDGKVGKVGNVYLDDTTQAPSWVTVKTGLFGNAESFVPLSAASLSGDEIRVSYGKDQIKDAPRLDTDAELSPDEEEALYRHYGLAASGPANTGTTETAAGTTAGTAAGTTGAGYGAGSETSAATTGGTRGAGNDTSGPNTDDAMTRSEERVNVGTATRESGRARLRKHIVTEHQTQNVGVSHEELRVDREPVTDANRGNALAGGDLTEEEHEVTLHEERPVVDKSVEPVERVRLGTEKVREQEQVGTDVRKEQIDVDTDGDTTRRGD